MRHLILAPGILWATATLAADQTVHLFSGYVSKLRCEGRLLVSAIGNDRLVQLEALPKELGCGLILKPLAQSGRTNLVLETSSGSSTITLEIRSGSPTSLELRADIRGDRL